MHINYRAYDGVESLNRFDDLGFSNYCDSKLKSVDKHIIFLKSYRDYFNNVTEIGSGSGKLLFRLENEEMLGSGIGYEISKSRCLFAEKFSILMNSNKIKIFNEDFLRSNEAEKTDLIIGIDIVVNLIGGIAQSLAENLINKSIRMLNPEGLLILEFQNFKKEKEISKFQNPILTWKEFNEEDPFQYGLDEIIMFEEKLKWKKIFIPRNRTDKLSYFEHECLILDKKFFVDRGFKIFDNWRDGDDTDPDEYIAVYQKI